MQSDRSSPVGEEVYRKMGVNGIPWLRQCVMYLQLWKLQTITRLQRELNVIAICGPRGMGTHRTVSCKSWRFTLPRGVFPDERQLIPWLCWKFFPSTMTFLEQQTCTSSMIEWASTAKWTRQWGDQTAVAGFIPTVPIHWPNSQIKVAWLHIPYVPPSHWYSRNPGIAIDSSIPLTWCRYMTVITTIRLILSWSNSHWMHWFTWPLMS